MATTIVTKNSSTAAAVPTAAQLVQGELAVNVADKRIYTEDSVGGIVELGTNPSAEIVANGGIALPDNGKATFGASDDLQIYHDGSDSIIVDNGTGDLLIRGSNSIRLQSHTGETYFKGDLDGSSRVYYDNAEKFKTTSSGIDVTGTATMDGLTVDLSSSGNVQLTGAANSNAGLVIRDPTATAYGAHFSYDDANTVVSIGGQTNGTKNTAISIGRDSNDISFYDDSGNAKFFWDASAEMLTTNGLTLDSANPSFQFQTTGGGATDAAYIQKFANDFYIYNKEATGNIFLGTNNGTDVTINSAGNVGIGTSSPSGLAHIYSSSSGATAGGGGDELILESSTTTGLSILSGTSNDGNILFGDSGNSAIGYVQYKHANNALSFGTSATERMRIDSSGRVGIGTSAPTRPLTVNGNNGTGMIINDAANDKALRFRATGDAFYIEATNNAESAYANLALAGDVGIGTSAPESGLHLVNDGLSNQLRLSNTTADSTTKYGSVLGSHYSNLEEPIVGMLLTSSSSATGGAVSIGGGISSANAVNTIKFYTAANNTTLTGTERMRIDSAGNLLVGTTNANNVSDGIRLKPAGFISAANTSGPVLYANRLSTDGSILSFQKDGTTVGSIGTRAGFLTIGEGAVGLLFQDANNRIEPTNMTTLAATNGTVDIGGSNQRFKDLYLSGGVYLGGTGAANKLDDYEEGTFVVTTAGDASGAFNETPTCYYTKIGNTVNVLIAFRVGTNFTAQSIGGLPFSVNHTGMSSSFISGGVSITSSANEISTTLGNNSTTIRFHNNQNTSDAHLPNTTNEYYRLNFTYRTTA